MPIMALITLAGGVGGTLLNKNAQGNRTSALNDIVNAYMQDYQLGRNSAFGTGQNGDHGMIGKLNDPITGNVNRSDQYIFGNEGDPGGALGLARIFCGPLWAVSKIHTDRIYLDYKAV